MSRSRTVPRTPAVRLDRPVLAGNLASGAVLLAGGAVLSWPLALVGAAYVVAASVFLAWAYARAQLTRRQEAAVWAVPWLAAVALWWWVAAGIAGGPSLLDLWLGLVVGTGCYLVWQVLALAARRLIAHATRRTHERPDGGWYAHLPPGAEEWERGDLDDLLGPRQPRIRIFCEVAISSPFWSDRGAVSPDHLHTEYAVSEQLLADFEAWADQYELTGLDLAPDLAVDPEEWVRRGQLLADRLQEAVGPGVEVVYQRALFGPDLYVQVDDASPWPLRDDGGTYDDTTMARLGIDPQLSAELLAWGREGHSQASPPESWWRHGRMLAERLSAAIGGDGTTIRFVGRTPPAM